MAFTRYYYPKYNFVLTECSGKIDDQTLLVHFLSFSSETRGTDYLRELVDMRYLRDSDQVTANGLKRLAKMHSNLFSEIKIYSAVLIDASSDKNPVEIFMQLFYGPNLEISVFNDGLKEPLAWLGYHGEDILKIKRFIETQTRPV